MKKFLLPLLLTALFFGMSAQVVCAAVRGIRLNATDYISLSDWARAKNLHWGWISRDKTLYVTNRAAKVLLVANSRQARVNNVDVWLLFPPANRSGAVYISEIDAETTLGPLLFPPRNAPGKTVKTICIDAGHGGKDPGNRVGKQYEKEYTLRLANELSAQLKKAGFNVTLTRSRDSYLDLSQRPAIARQKNADLFVSVHFNAVASGRGSVKGAETYALTPDGARSTAAGGKGPLANLQPGNRNDEKNMLLAYQIQRSLVRTLPVEDRGVRRARFQVLREATMPAVLIEGGFMSHPTEGKKIFDAAYRRTMAKAIVEGIQAYKRAVE